MYLLLPVKQSTPALVSSILSQSSSDLHTEQADIKDETIKQVAQIVNQTLLKTSTSNHISSLTQNNPPHDNIIHRQSICNPNSSNVHSQTNTQLIHMYRPVSPKTALHIQLHISSKPNKS